MAWIKYHSGAVNLDQVCSIDVQEENQGGHVIFNLVNGESAGIGTFAGTKADALLAVTRMVGAVDSEIYDIRNYEEEES